jgi:hypothetical protein
MTSDEITRISSLMEAAGRRNVPVPIEEWKTLMKTAHDKITDGLLHALAYAKIDAILQGFVISDKATHFDRGYLQGLLDARELFGTEHKVSTKSIGKVSAKALAKGEIKPIRKQSASQRAAGNKKASRVVKGLKANRARSALKAKGK